MAEFRSRYGRSGLNNIFMVFARETLASLSLFVSSGPLVIVSLLEIRAHRWLIDNYLSLLSAICFSSGADSIFRCLLCCVNRRASCLSALLMHLGCVCLAAANHLWQYSFLFIKVMIICHGELFFAGLHYSVWLVWKLQGWMYVTWRQREFIPPQFVY